MASTVDRLTSPYRRRSRPYLRHRMSSDSSTRPGDRQLVTISSSDVRGLQHPLRLRHAIALRVVDPQALQHVDDLLVLRELGNGLLAGQMPDLVDRTHHLAVDGIVQYLFDEA